MRRLIAVAGVVALAAGGWVSPAANAGTALAASPHAVAASAAEAGTFHPVGSARVLDTRRTGSLASAGVARFGVAGHGPIPVGAGAVTVNVTVLSPAQAGSVSVFPGNTGWNGAASISFAAGQSKQSMITAVLGSDGSLAVRNNTAGPLQVIADVGGYYAGGTASAPGTFRAVGFQRVFDTRAVGSHSLPPGSVTPVSVAGRGTLPASGVAAVVANLTVIGAARSGSVSAYASGTEWDGSASASFAAGRSEQDVLSISLGSDGAMLIRNNTAVPLQVVLDVFGYFLAGTPADYGTYMPVSPFRFLDQRRAGQFSFEPGDMLPVAPGGGRDSGLAPVPAWGIPATVIRFSILSPARAGTLSVYRADQGWNGAASISFPAGVSVQQQLITPLGQDQQLMLRNNTGATLTVVADVLGYYLGVPNPYHSAGGGWVNSLRGASADVSCASPTFCLTVQQNGYTETWNGTAWSDPVKAPPAFVFDSVSCVSASFCVAAGWEGDPELFDFDGTRWTYAAILSYQPGQIPRISCASTSFCLGTAGSGYRTFDGIKWSAEQPFQTQTLLSLSCPSASFCAAVDQPGHIYTFNGTAWSGPASIAGMTSPQSVSCTSAGFCAAVGDHGTAAAYDGTSWAVTGSLDGGRLLRSVSCASSTDCRAVDRNGFVISYDGHSWSAPVGGWPPQGIDGAISCSAAATCAVVNRDDEAAIFDGANWGPWQLIAVEPAEFSAVSCTSGSFCMATDSAGYAIRYDSTGWNAAVLLARPNGLQTTALLGVSCAAPSICLAVDSRGQAYRYDGSSWSAPAAVDPGQRLNGVSCASPSFCVAVGRDGKAAIYNGSNWTAPASISKGELVGVSCPSSTLCLAFDDYRNAEVFNGTGWSTGHPTGVIWPRGITCASTTFCIATGDSALNMGEGVATRWDNGSWTPLETSANQGIGAVSCPSTQLCIATEEYNGGGPVVWDGSQWTMPLTNTPTLKISCPTSNFCMTVGGWTAYQLNL